MRTNLRLLFTLVLMSIVLVLGLIGYQIYYFKHNYRHEFMAEKTAFGEQTASIALSGIQTSNYFELSRLCSGLYRPEAMLYLAILDDSGQSIQVRTEKDMELVLPVLGKQRLRVTSETVFGEEILFIDSPIVDEVGKKWGKVEGAYYLSPVYKLLKSQILMSFAFFVTFVSIWGGVLFFRAKALLEPLDQFVTNLGNIQAEWPISLEMFNARLVPENANRDVKVLLNVLKTSLLKLLEHQEALKKAEKIAVLGNLSAQVAHDIRSPLAALGAAAKGLEMPKEKRRLIEGAVGRMQDIADDLLQRYRAPSAVPAKSKMAVYALAEIIEPVLAEKRLQHKEKAGIIEFNGASAEIKALVEPKELQRILSNLVNNSVEAFDGAGTIFVGLSAPEGKVLIEVKDNGRGISPEILAKLGRKGGTYGKSGGNGLGLYHALTTIERWGGSFKIKSELGKGTSVLIELPSVVMHGADHQVVLLDDDMLVHMNWKVAAKAAGVGLKAYKTPKDFAAGIETLTKDTPIYIDSDLGSDIKGEDIAKDLHEKGFTDITMATGHAPEKFAHLPWLKVAGKESPWV